MWLFDSFEDPFQNIMFDPDFASGAGMVSLLEASQDEPPPPPNNWESDSFGESVPANPLERNMLDLQVSPLQLHRSFDLYEALPFRFAADGDFLYLEGLRDIGTESGSKDSIRTANDDVIIIVGVRPPSLAGTGGGSGDGGSGDTIDHQAGFNTGSESGGSTGEECDGAPSSNWAADDPEVQDALQTAGADEAGVSRAIENWDTIVWAANSAGIDPALLGAIALRESNFRNIDQPDGLGRGVFQIDLGAHPNVSEFQAENLAFAASYAANLLAANMAYLASAYPSFTHEQLMQATAASYNFGTNDISGNPDTIDVGTTGDNYGSNVLALMDAFKDPETGDTPGAGEDNGGCDCGC